MISTNVLFNSAHYYLTHLSIDLHSLLILLNKLTLLTTSQYLQHFTFTDNPFCLIIIPNHPPHLDSCQGSQWSHLGAHPDHNESGQLIAS